ncbi:MAG: alanine dehydrogenase [Myxococcales bacterium]|nr:alanine dehydrogenase [Myxococcales bacterium]MCB9731393.1 alanine dehydrogenase [Deltaproteobacteria bacterium]
MIVGIPTEIKSQENRVGMVPGGVKQLTAAGHQVLVQRGAGQGSGVPDEDYVRMGARLVDDAAEVWGQADMVVKVKEPIPSEYGHFRKGQILFTYLHLAAVPELGAELLRAGVTGVAYETIEDTHGRLPLLKPMSEIAGKMATQVGAHCLEKHQGGMGLLLGGVAGTKPGHVVVLGGGTVGTNAAKIAVGMGARVTLLDRNLDRLTYLDDVFHGRIMTLHSNPETIEHSVRQADLLVGGVLVAGARAPKLVSEALVREMKPGSVIVDVSVDQGGCIETCHPTTHKDPTYLVGEVVHYCVANMPGAVARTSTYALTNATTEYTLRLANLGLEAAVAADKGLRLGLNTKNGACTHPAVAEALGYDYVAPEAA